MKNTRKQNLAKVQGRAGLFYIACGLLALVFLTFLSLDRLDGFQRWLGGGIGVLCLIAIGLFGSQAFIRLEETIRDIHCLEADKEAMCRMIENEQNRK